MIEHKESMNALEFIFVFIETRRIEAQYERCELLLFKFSFTDCRNGGRDLS
jgi:hypothetical protein